MGEQWRHTVTSADDGTTYGLDRGRGQTLNQLTPKLRKAVMQGRTLSESEMNELCDILTTSIDVPLLPKSAARPLFRSVVESLFGPQNSRVVKMDWNAVLSSGVGLENEQYRERLAMNLAAAIDVPGMRQEKQLAVAQWVLNKTTAFAVKVLPPKLLPLLRASSTKDLEKMRPGIAASILETIDNVPGGVILPKKTKEKLANASVDYLYENYINKSPARLRLMSPSEREDYEIESLRNRLANLEQTQESLLLQTRLAISQLWQNHWKKLSIRWILRGKVMLRILRKVAIVSLGIGVGAALGCLICVGLGRWDMVTALHSETQILVSVAVAYSASAFTQVSQLVHLVQILMLQGLLAMKVACVKVGAVLLSLLGRFR
eukprot:1176342-Prorocentrum_minimum.AAC.3